MTANPRLKPFHSVNTPFADALLRWYGRHARDLPWRIGPTARARGEQADPYRVWLSEIMLQQTTVPHATRYFLAFTERWPTVADLASAAEEEVMAAWAGLGYYARARNLLKCARQVSALGAFPEAREELRKLPGIGAYTSGAMAAIAFGERVPAVDGNVERVFARQLALESNIKQAKTMLAECVGDHVPADKPGQFAEALMDLGATVCTPKRPNCLVCPVSEFCAARAAGTQERYPIKAPKVAKPHRRGHVFVSTHGDEVLLERRPEQGLLGGMLGFPGSDWCEGPLARPVFPATGGWADIGEVRHVFTHFSLTLTVWRVELQGERPDGLWSSLDALEGLPSVFAKAARIALD